MRGFAAQPTCSTSKLVIEYLAEQFGESHKLVGLAIHASSVLTRMGAKSCLKEFQHYLDDEPGL